MVLLMWMFICKLIHCKFIVMKVWQVKPFMVMWHTMHHVQYMSSTFIEGWKQLSSLELHLSPHRSLIILKSLCKDVHNKRESSRNGEPPTLVCLRFSSPHCPIFIDVESFRLHRRCMLVDCLSILLQCRFYQMMETNSHLLWVSSSGI